MRQNKTNQGANQQKHTEVGLLGTDHTAAQSPGWRRAPVKLTVESGPVAAVVHTISIILTTIPGANTTISPYSPHADLNFRTLPFNR